MFIFINLFFWVFSSVRRSFLDRNHAVDGNSLCFLNHPFCFFWYVSFVYLWFLLIVIPLETTVFYYGIYKSSFSELCTDFNVGLVDEMLSLDMRNEHEKPCVSYLEDEDLELSPSCGMCATFYNIVPSLHVICMACRYPSPWGRACKCFSTWDKPFVICKCSPRRDETCMTCSANCKCSPRWDATSRVSYYEIDLLKSILLLYDTCDACERSLSWDMILCEAWSFKLILPLKKVCTTCNHSHRKCKACQFG